MNHSILQSIIPLACSSLALIGAGVCMALLYKTRAANRLIAESLSQSEADLAELSQDLDTLSKKCGELARKVMALESNASALSFETAMEEGVAVTSQKLTITERRHRVRVLARRGKNAEAIAATLGMPRGEVQLIMGLAGAA
jgi:uncharacterized protein YlxW (UPF0749 family)